MLAYSLFTHKGQPSFMLHACVQLFCNNAAKWIQVKVQQCVATMALETMTLMVTYPINCIIVKKKSHFNMDEYE